MPRPIHGNCFGLLGCLLALFVVVAMPGTATAQSTPYNSLTLLWTAPGDDGMVGQVYSYQLRYRTTPISGTDTTGWWNGTPGAQQLTLGGPHASAGATDSTKVTGLTSGTTYYFVLRALDESFNISGFSNVAVGTTQTCTAPSNAPGSFAAVADTDEVVLSWNSTSDPLAQSINIYRATGTSGNFTLLTNRPLSSTSYHDTNVSSGTTYRYRAAWMGASCEGPIASAGPVTTPGTAPPPPPTAATEEPSIHIYPNPVSTSLRLVVEVTASTAQTVLIRLYDVTGHWIATLADGTFPPGSNEVTWGRAGRDGNRVAPGYYEVLGTVGDSKVRERIILLP
ncbi:MAG: fibronectin type III domain-containing protein [Candidatus Eiseniibacteriota bacterium]